MNENRLLATDLDHVYMADFYNQFSSKGVLTSEDFTLIQSHLERVTGKNHRIF